ncbi:uncharacterized [Tachysurus ichikawai]
MTRLSARSICLLLRAGVTLEALMVIKHLLGKSNKHNAEGELKAKYLCDQVSRGGERRVPLMSQEAPADVSPIEVRGFDITIKSCGGRENISVLINPQMKRCHHTNNSKVPAKTVTRRFNCTKCQHRCTVDELTVSALAYVQLPSLLDLLLLDGGCGH